MLQQMVSKTTAGKPRHPSDENAHK